MERTDRSVVLHRKEILDQEYADIQEKIKVIAETLTEFSHNLSLRPEHIVIAVVSPEQTRYQDNKIYFNKDQLKQAFNLELIDEYLMSLQHKDRELEVLAKELKDN
jgi:GTPase involved in cell partitioning and DNA repair